ncbi:MAG: hypothetical protein AAF340_14555 [Pseudomonadota bacterium]
MTSIKGSLLNLLGVLGAIVLAPFVALFGLVMLGLGFGLSVIAVLAMSLMARRVHASDTTEPHAEHAEPVF